MGVIYLMRLILYRIHPSSVFSAANHCLSKRSSDFVSVLLQYRIPIGKSVTHCFTVHNQSSRVFMQNKKYDETLNFINTHRHRNPIPDPIFVTFRYGIDEYLCFSHV